MAYEFKKRLLYFLDNGYWHGIRFLGSRCNLWGRIFWLIVIMGSGIGMAIILQITLENFQEDVININVDTTFLHWRNTFPAVSVCLTKGGSATRILNFMKQYWEANNLPIPKNYNRFVLWIRTYLFVSPNQSIDEFSFCETQNETCGFDVDTIMELFMPQECEDFMSDVTFLGRSYNCSDIFKPITSEMGLCFTANSLHIHKNIDELPLVYYQYEKQRTLNFKYIESVDIYSFVMYVHSPEELPYFDMEPVFLAKVAYQHFLFEAIEIVNSNEVLLESIEQRNCRFPDERMPNSVLPYSFSSCFTDKRIEIEFKMCNCTLHTSPIEYKDQYCDYKGLLCVSEAEVPEMIKDAYKSEQMCMESCIEMEIKTLGDFYDNGDDDDDDGEAIAVQPNRYTTAERLAVVVEIANMPTVRYVRNVGKKKLDFVVSVGGLVGLFFGASLLSLVELLYIWLIRRF